MVETRVDAMRVPTITLSEAELSEIEELMSRGDLAPDFLERHFQAVEDNVFGHDHKLDDDGNPVEQGIGSAGNQTRNSVEAYKKYGKYEHGHNPEQFAANVKRMEAELAACNKLRTATAKRKGRARR